jgi:hypothetical protein
MNVDFWVSTVHYQTNFYFETWLLISIQSNTIKNYANNSVLQSVIERKKYP